MGLMVVPVLEQPTVPTLRAQLDAPERTGHDGAVARRSTLADDAGACPSPTRKTN